MKLSELKKHLNTLKTIKFQLPNGSFVPKHFHITEIGQVTKNFIDCGGTIRNEEVVTIQLWSSIDFMHRLQPQKLLKIIALSEQTLNLIDAEIEVEYQGKTIEKYGIDFNGEHFILTHTKTDCLAKKACGIPTIKLKKKLSEIKASCCSPDSGCC